jgi:hypothetical protein
LEKFCVRPNFLLLVVHWLLWLICTLLSKRYEQKSEVLFDRQHYLAGATEHATLAISQPDATNTMRLHAGLMAIALSNIKAWVTTIEQDALYLLKNPADLAKVQEMVTFADDAYHGVDVNGDGQIDPVTGEAGALTAYLQGQLMATLSLAPGP